MGATTFLIYSAGKDAADAFQSSVDKARYDHGHRGYTGTIAEKHGFRVFDPPKGTTAREFADLIYKMNSSDSEQRMGNPEKNRQLIADAEMIFDDKWGPAVCIPLEGKELKEAKVRLGIERRREKVYIFCGWASC